MTRRFLTSTLFATMLLVTSCKEAPKQAGATKSSYKLKSIEQVDFSTSTQYSASIRGRQDIDLYPQVGGYLNKILVTEGESVKKGQPLFVIEQTPYLAAYEASKANILIAEAQVANAELSYKNSKSLFEKQIISDSELQAAQNQLDSAKSQLALANAQMLSAKTNLGFTVIKSPSDGVVGKLPYRQGALVSASLPASLTTISDNSKMYVYFSMGENKILDLLDTYGSLDNMIKEMPDVKLILNNGTTYTHAGAIESVSGVIDSSTGSVSLRAVFPNEERRLLSGGAGNIIINELHKDVITIPKTSTYELQDRFFVYKVVDGKAKSTMVKLAKQHTDGEYIVLEGLTAGDIIIATGAGLVRDGSPVNQ